MEQFVFPAVLYKDAENRGYTIILNDVNICTEGTSVEDAFLRAKEFLEVYCRCAMEYNGEIEPATKFEDVDAGKNNIVLLVDAIYDGDSSVAEPRFSIDLN